MKIKTAVCMLLIFTWLIRGQQGIAHPSFNVGHALSALENGDLETAEAELQKARFSMPDSPEIQYNLGVVSYRKRDYALAARHFAMAAAGQAQSETRFSSLYNMGNATFRMGDYAAAVAAYESCLELKKDEQAEYNLKVAREKLQKQLEKQQASEQQQQQQPQTDQGEKQSQQPGGEKSQNENKQGQAGDNKQEQNDQSGQNDSSEKKEGEQSDSQQAGSDKKDDASQNEAKSGQQPDAGDSEQEKPKDNASASGTQQLTQQQAGGENEPREDVQMQPEEAGAKDMPEASQRARALKNTKVNPYMIEKILKEMERREKEAQLYYRNEPRRSDEIDPFEMDAQQLREWMEKRRRPQAPKPSDGPDW
ncbi:MAG TPA: tetratricopeptide repeat protein [Candidatus Rifleibacterium sp.]|nr:tetratricopeptide repeat protein [Candidatus Rifleibacterium sp.]